MSSQSGVLGHNSLECKRVPRGSWLGASRREYPPAHIAKGRNAATGRVGRARREGLPAPTAALRFLAIFPIFPAKRVLHWTLADPLKF